MLKKLVLSTIFFSLAATAKLQYKTYVASPDGFEVVSTLIYGENDAVLIDAQFTLANAHRLVAKILELGKNLTTVYITHSHPDHYWGLEVIKQAFPDVKIYAREAIIARMRVEAAEKLALWKPLYKANVTSAPVFPQGLPGNSIEIEGESLEISAPLQGDDSLNTYVFVPSLNALVTGDIVYNDANLWLIDAPKPEQRAAWLNSLALLASKNADIVIAGHKPDGAPDSPAAIEFSKNYITAFNKLVDDKATAEQIKTSLSTQFPNATATQAVLDLVAKTYGTTP